jgi:hypothetical protein
MKSIMMAAALMLGGAAVAQTTDEDVAGDPLVGGDMPRIRAPIPAGNTSPETDARGIPVISAPAVPPAGYNEGPRTMPAGTPMPTVTPPTPTASGPLPPCTRKVTDRCTQTYERGVRLGFGVLVVRGEDPR